MEVTFLLSAEVDLVEVYRRHGERVHASIEAALGLLKTFPEAGPVVAAPIRRKFVRRTPYAIYYVPEGRRLVVHAIVDQREDPSTIATRLRKI